MKISVLIPTKNGMEICNGAINSIIETSTGKNDIEILLKIDIDDQNSINGIENIKYKDNVKIILSNEKNRSSYLHEFINELYKLSTGDWILPTFNDDARILTKNWDNLLEEYDPNTPMILYHLPIIGRKSDIGDYFFPIVSKKYLELTKRISTVPTTDGYLLRISNLTGIGRKINIQFEHIHGVESKSNWKSIWEAYYKTDIEKDLNEDSSIILEYLKKQ